MSRIAAACAPCGFKYYKSRRSMIQPLGSFTAEIRFSSHSSNMAGIYLDFNTNCRIINMHSGKVYWEISLSSFRDKGTEIITLIQNKVVPLMDKYETNLEEILEEVIQTGWFLQQANPILEFYVLDVLDLVVDFGSPEQIRECAHRYIRSLSEEMQETFKNDYNAYQRDGQAASTIAFRKLIPFMTERNISLPL